MARCKALQDEIRTLSDSQLVPLLKGARVIGCTATGAAKYKELLQNPDIAPTVVMVEEAGELHESHTLTSLSERTKQLILVRGRGRGRRDDWGLEGRWEGERAV